MTDPTGVYFFSWTEQYKELSNYYIKSDNSTLFEINGVPFRSSEHAYQYYKFFYDGADKVTLEYAELIRNAKTANDAKLLAGQKLKGGYQTRMNPLIEQYQGKAKMRSDWDSVKIEIMWIVIYLKFSQDDSCKQVLLSTIGKNIYENSPYDYFWGLGKDGTGSNNLGYLLVKLRDIIIQSERKE